LIIRKHILNLMCRLETSWHASTTFSDMDKTLELLQEMQDDGLVEIGENHIKITEAGRTFTRNVAMTFDLRMLRHQPETRIFSMTV